MKAAQKKELIQGYAKTYITESDRGNNFGALNAKYQCCVTFYLCEYAQFNRIVAKLRKVKASSDSRI